jgi:hypothetical protein
MHAVLCNCARSTYHFNVNCARNIFFFSISKFLLMKLLYILELIEISMYAIVYYYRFKD